MDKESISNKAVFSIIIVILCAAVLANFIGYRVRILNSNQNIPIKTWNGFIRNIRTEGNKTTLEIDTAEILTGEEAFTAAIEDSGCTREEVDNCIPSLYNNFYIRKTSATTSNFNLSSFPDITILEGGSPDEKKAALNEFISLYDSENSILRSALFEFQSRDSVIEKLSQKYSP